MWPDVREDHLEHAVLTACAFREDFEFCSDRGLAFDVPAAEFYRGWQNKYVFEMPVAQRVAAYPKD